MWEGGGVVPRLVGGVCQWSVTWQWPQDQRRVTSKIQGSRTSRGTNQDVLAGDGLIGSEGSEGTRLDLTQRRFFHWKRNVSPCVTSSLAALPGTGQHHPRGQSQRLEGATKTQADGQKPHRTVAV